MLIEYIGNKEGFTLRPPYVEEATEFKDGKAEIDDDFAKALVKRFPRTFRRIEEVVPEVLTEKFLSSLTGRDGLDKMEKIGIDRFGVDLNKSDGKKKMIVALLDLQAKAEG